MGSMSWEKAESTPSRAVKGRWKLAIAAVFFLAGSFTLDRYTLMVFHTKSSSKKSSIPPTGIIDNPPAVRIPDDTTKNCINKTANGPVMEGVDFVAYWSLYPGSPAIMGTPDYAANYSGYTFYFSSEENMEKFQSNPSKYSPQYGAFCTYGVANEDFWSLATIGPFANVDSWQIMDNKLYLFMYSEPQKLFNEGKISTELKQADERWASWFPNGEIAFNTKCYWDCATGGRNDDSCSDDQAEDDEDDGGEQEEEEEETDTR